MSQWTKSDSASAGGQNCCYGKRCQAKQCSLCGSIYHSIAFKGGYICEDCVDFIKGRT
ncbi:MAG: hypothetical protein HFE73_06455 [Firmicutes bacterium]|nr:hypothetical protein [Bacillota bacterium]